MHLKRMKREKTKENVERERSIKRKVKREMWQKVKRYAKRP